jgi:hypothetical protein
MPEEGGTPCDPHASEQTGKCERHCHDTYVCEWGSWQSIVGEECSVECGGGKIKRVRTLKPTKAPQGLFLTDMHGPVAASGDQRVRELFLSFACGGLVSFAAIGLALRAFRRADPSYTAPMDNEREVITRVE